MMKESSAAGAKALAQVLGSVATDVVEIRPMRHGEEDVVRAVFDGLSDESRFLRFHVPTPRLTGPALQQLTSLQHGGAFVARDNDLPVGVGRWVRQGAAGRAEFSLAVSDSHQGKGLGSALLAHLRGEASRAGIMQLVGHVHPENVRVREWLLRLGAMPEGDTMVLEVGPQARAPELRGDSRAG
jgi:GNAT superfamily N-acetyltransferase